ncbi:hypothetical protein M436DRAFT_59964 [Aureobasidium namibiae CBS 147.97]|uniref:Uncharacterized protein n=1 Tax=Aureobasidium namibiae CBS 147.97 TaxID=1043004 RepID=A0A074XTW5_9PEZI|nr:uncharacterized protein M436DRAFT_59964 [Aureobasidium namibiae CBS 147.97]KEQ78026.1 hypothetical protein M436DRAFT_59964 [Aureobasidium namibiae CBS 147.97]
MDFLLIPDYIAQTSRLFNPRRRKCWLGGTQVLQWREVQSQGFRLRHHRQANRRSQRDGSQRPLFQGRTRRLENRVPRERLTKMSRERTAITWYKLAEAEWYSPFKYKLTINCKDTYCYFFTDKDEPKPETYMLNVFRNPGTHSRIPLQEPDYCQYLQLVVREIFL